MKQALGLERLFDEIHRPAAHRRNGGVDIPVAGKDDDRQVGLARLDRVEYLEPVHRAAVEPHVEQHQAGPALVDHFQRLHAAAGGAAFVAFVAQHAGDQFADVAFVVDDENVESHQLPLKFRMDVSSRSTRGSLARVIDTRVPPSPRAPKLISPPCSSTILLTIARPSPVPFSRVVT